MKLAGATFKLFVDMRRVINICYHYCVDGWETSSPKYIRAVLFWLTTVSTCLLTAEQGVSLIIWIQTGNHLFSLFPVLGRIELLVLSIWIIAVFSLTTTCILIEEKS